MPESRFESLEFVLGCRLLLELRMLFALEETDSTLELMMLFLCSSEEKNDPKKVPCECQKNRERLLPHIQQFANIETNLKYLML